jgi:hypothetical protein
MIADSDCRDKKQNRGIMQDRSALALTILLGCLFAPNAHAKHKDYAPLPVALMNARSVYIANESPDAIVGDRAYSELRKWGRFKIVQSRKDADVVFVFSMETHEAGYVTTASAQTNGTASFTQTSDTTVSGNVSTTTSGSATTRPIVRGNVFLHVVDAHTGNEIWSNVEYMGIHGAGHKAAVLASMGYAGLFMHQSATREIIKDLRKRMESQSQ